MNGEDLRVGICDDKEEEIDGIVEALRLAVKGEGRAVKISCFKCTNGDALCEASSRDSFHLFFLDIEMPEMDGFKLARRLNVNQPNAHVIFVSAHENYVFDAHEYMPLWFVRKGRLERDMQRAMRKYFQVTASARISYRLKDGIGYRNLLIQDILYIECSGHTLMIQQVDGGRMEKYGSLKSLEKDLEGYHFLRIHKNYLVNQKYIEEVGRREVYLVDKSVLEMGRDRRTAVRDAMLQYEKEHYEEERLSSVMEMPEEESGGSAQGTASGHVQGRQGD